MNLMGFFRLTSQEVFEIVDEIEQVNRKMLEKILDENEFVAVYFCKPLRHSFLAFPANHWSQTLTKINGFLYI